jgi:L-lysine exporter family protein LysE/ArgO
MSAFWMPALAGLLTGAGLIIAIGPQNVFVLRQGVRRAHVAQVVAVCAVSDVVLITAGVAGLGALVSAHPALITVATLLGGAYVIVLGLMAAKRSLRSGTGMATDTGEAATTSRWMAIGTALALTWLNPHVYLDTVVLLGSIAQSHPGRQWWFAAGAVIGSTVWFTALGYGAALLRPLFATARAWRVLDAVIALVMLALAVSLVVAAA